MRDCQELNRAPPSRRKPLRILGGVSGHGPIHFEGGLEGLHDIVLLGDGHDVALGLPLDPELRKGVAQDHESQPVDADEDHVGIHRRLGERVIENGIRLLGDGRDGGDGRLVDPARLQDRADVVLRRSFLQGEQPVGQAADAAVGVIGSGGGEGLLGAPDPEDAACRDLAGPSVPIGLGGFIRQTRSRDIPARRPERSRYWRCGGLQHGLESSVQRTPIPRPVLRLFGSLFGLHRMALLPRDIR